MARDRGLADRPSTSGLGGAPPLTTNSTGPRSAAGSGGRTSRFTWLMLSLAAFCFAAAILTGETGVWPTRFAWGVIIFGALFVMSMKADEAGR